ncbi:MAG: hypothetical protein IKJ01_02905 [Lachnospiraceae bacterium]|nr:hypothetical protein [Lachnospiraceae bacterium]
MYNEFKNNLIQKLKEELPNDIELFNKVIIKNNHVVKEFLTFRIENMEEIPIIAWDNLYEDYKKHKNLEKTCKSLIQFMIEAGYIKMPEILNREWDSVKKRIYPYLINKEWNQEFLENIVFKSFLDLAIIYKIHLKEERSMCSYPISKEMLRNWEINEKELFEIAMNNLKSKEFIIYDIRKLINEFSFEEIENKEYVMTNKTRYDGACGILRIDLLELLAQKHQKNIYIFPNSIEEVTLILEEEKIKPRELAEIMKKISIKEIEQELWLSNNIYYFNRITKQMEIVV